MAENSNAILQKMLERLFASLVSGPGMNCRPHSSRQRVDVAQLGRLGDQSPEHILKNLLEDERRVKLTGRVARPKREFKKAKGETGILTETESGSDVEMSEEEKRAARQWSEQQALVGKLRTIAEDARTYEQDTGVHVLNIGFPLLSIAPGSNGRGGGAFSRRIVAPIAFIPVVLEVKAGAAVAVEIACKGEGVDLVRPNIALLAWLEQQTGKKTPELFDDREAENPWREIRALVEHVAQSMGLAVPASINGEAGLAEDFALAAAPRADDEGKAGEILLSAVMGLYPMANEGLLRDMQAMAGESAKLEGPVKSFLEVNVDLSSAPVESPAEETTGKKPRVFGEERLVTQADPCQSRAALLARKAAGLVIHGPPGTGKSQTITNIIGDHLARGQRVLMVCDKRTALDVVAHRLEHLGFGPLMALVHDPQRDQRDLYKAIRERLENLPELRTHSTAARDVERLDAELQQLHNDLSAYWKSLMQRGEREVSFHDAMGEWLAIDGAKTGALRLEGELAGTKLAEGRSAERIIREMLERGRTSLWPENPWAAGAGIALRDFLARPMEYFRGILRQCAEAAKKTLVAVDVPLPALGEGDLAEQGALRLDVAERLEKLMSFGFGEVTGSWSQADGPAVKRGIATIDSQRPFVNTFRATLGKLDGELRTVIAGQWPTVPELSARLGKLNEYLTIARKWYAFACVKKKNLGREVLMPLGMGVNAINADRAKEFLIGIRARLVVRQMLADLVAEPAPKGPMLDDELLDQLLTAHETALELLTQLQPAGREALSRVARGVMRQPATAAAVVAALRKSAARAEAVKVMEQTLLEAGLFSPAFLASIDDAVRKEGGGGTGQAGEIMERYIATLGTLEDVLRIHEGLPQMPAGIQAAVKALLAQSAGAEEGMAAYHRALLAAEISRRLREDPWLQAMDGQRLKSTFERYRDLDQKKRQLVREAVLHLWVSRQKERLLASTQTRASTLGADLRRRLTTRGERALRLRQVIEVGSEMEGGDPLFDMSPVWMASPETVAQIFPRHAMFDVVIFDEASQCRLEEALPVLMRGKRVVIAGDPKQLPPTRFFESAISVSEDDDADGQQSLFERQQGEVEDLLTAALNLSIENAYLDVHYRSRNSDLISFSNEQFYHHRLQAIPGHPKNRNAFSPLTLYCADGIYEERANEKEADQVCRIVRDLLRRAQPPSIGIACFNMVQRDLISEKLDVLSMEDAEFGRRLGQARARRGAGSFEGLFVKNLENVQGDERDHIIISTTYGPTKEGRFYQRFGPLGRAGGGRRLNVLVTRAREEVHLVTSIPAEVYRNLPPVPAGQTPGGPWLLFAYLRFAERLGQLYAAARNKSEGMIESISEAGTPAAEAEESASISQPESAPAPEPAVVVYGQPRSLPSQFAENVARQLAKHHAIGSTVHWGNDGFCVDIALAHPARAEDVTIGILCDGSRFQNADDPVEWDLFRTLIHESQGWKLHRIWTPQFFRQPAEHLDAVAARAREEIAQEKPPDALGVVRTDG